MENSPANPKSSLAASEDALRPLGDGRSAAVIVASTSAAAGQSEDKTGPMLVSWFRDLGYACPEPIVAADGAPVADALSRLLQGTAPRFIVTTGGTGLNPDDRTPEATAKLVDFEVPGIMHALWSRGLSSTPSAVMSRGVAGVTGQTFIVNLPGSRGGVRDGITVLTPLLSHIQEQIEDVHGHGTR
ncbi:MogA/MoaB family molybdenum cofactor biosynthesis protein [Gulosibacter molinativorax]|uniref:MogA/MoaB family molybdenum cofactor biosynthesis protein n=2 Tax=Gulosibacter molinativorax TaxID=256821 RepID=A0ABT7C5V6_9MICO|nr:MogA/MoaB family molybdenum cofactor biosynthesis protein [Gulosibacter molinativorax]QUY62024.1 Molybdopterin adenylyltransferase [Gulosibacter molinativorax]